MFGYVVEYSDCLLPLPEIGLICLTTMPEIHILRVTESLVRIAPA